MRPLSTDIQSPCGRVLGDCWSVASYFINLGLERGETIRLSRWYRKGPARKRVDKLTEVVPLFEHDDFVQLVDEDPTEPIIHWSRGYAYPLIPTKIQWRANDSRKISYQFDGKSKKGLKMFPSKAVEDEVLASLTNAAYELVRLGSQMSLYDCVLAASQCEAFVGIDSGMSYLAASVGNVRLWHIEDARREYCAGPAKEEEKARGFLDKVAAVNRERNSLIDQINAAFKVLLDKMSGSDSSWVVSAEELLGFGKNKFYKEEA